LSEVAKASSGAVYPPYHTAWGVAVGAALGFFVLVYHFVTRGSLGACVLGVHVHHLYYGAALFLLSAVVVTRVRSPRVRFLAAVMMGLFLVVMLDGLYQWAVLGDQLRLHC
jgi:hypothetical protein